MLDGYVHILKSALPTIPVHHVASAIDMSIAVPSGIDSVPQDVVTGYTEWAGTWCDAEISVGWDWGIVRTVIVVLNPSEIRTNIQLVTEDGFVEPLMLTRIHLLDWIESLPWRNTAIKNLLQQG